MDRLITLCRDVEGQTTTDCIEDHEGLDASLVAPCKVVMAPCDAPEAAEPVGPEADSSAVFQEMKGGQDCCDC